MSHNLNDDSNGVDWHDDQYEKEVADAKHRIFTAANEAYARFVENAKKKAIERAKKKQAASKISAERLKTNNLEIPVVPAKGSTIKTQPSQSEKVDENTTSVQSNSRFALVVFDLDNIVLNNYDRKMNTYLEVGWDKKSIHNFISKKENMYGKIASFNTTRVTFTASSRRNRYYEVYNRSDMLEYDKAFNGVIDAINALSENFDIYIVSERTVDLENKTIEIMKKQGFKMDNIKVYFKKTHEVLRSYKKACMVDIKSRHATGVALIIHPQDASVFSRFDYTPVGFTSICESSSFNGNVDVVCENWSQVKAALKQ